MYTFYFDNTIVSNPINFDELSENITRNDDLRGVFHKIESKLTFTEDAYAYLYNKKQSDGYCEFVSLIITKQCGSNIETIFEGNIRISDVVFNLSKCIAECQIEDNSYGARIFNNKNIKTFINSGKSKNGVAITPVATIPMRFYTPSTGILNLNIINCFDVMETLTYLVKFMTDGQMNVISDWYTALPIDERICLTTGKELRTRQHLNLDVPCIAFDELFKELNKKYNLGISIEKINNVQTLRIEPMTYFFDTNNSITTANIPDLEEYINTYLLYSEVSVGSNKTADFDNTIDSMPPIRFLTFNEESYIIQGQCNIDRKLDLVSSYIIDSNVIEEVRFTNTNSTTYDNDIFMIQYEYDVATPLFPYKSVMWNDITAQPPVFFNKVLTNSSVCDRWNMQGAIAQYLNATDNTFRATQSVISSLYRPYSSYTPATINTAYGPVPFDNDSTGGNFDNGNNYNTTTYRYTAQANGIYTFEVTQLYTLQDQEWQGVCQPFPSTVCDYSVYWVTDQWRINANVYNGVTLQRQVYKLTPFLQWNVALWFLNQTVPPIPGTFSPIIDLANVVTIDVYMNAGEEVEFTFQAALNEIYKKVQNTTPANNTALIKTTGGNTYYFKQSSVQCIATSDGGGIYQGKDPEDYHVSMFKYDYPISDTDWSLIKASPSKAINFGISNATKNGWINNISRNTTTGMASIELISNIKNTK